MRATNGITYGDEMVVLRVVVIVFAVDETLVLLFFGSLLLVVEQTKRILHNRRFNTNFQLKIDKPRSEAV